MLADWLRRVFGITDAREAEARTRRGVDTIHTLAAEVTENARERRRAIGRQDWPRLYRERLEDRVEQP